MKRSIQVVIYLFALCILLAACGEDNGGANRNASCNITVNCNISQSGSNNGNTTPNAPPSGQTSNTSSGTTNTGKQPIIWQTSHYYGGNPVTITGPAIVECDCSVNGTFLGDGQLKDGTIIEFKDTTQYNLGGPNQGTIYKALGTPTDADFTNEVNSIVPGMKSNRCTGGCSIVNVFVYQSGQQIQQYQR